MRKNWVYYGIVLFFSIALVYFHGDRTAYITLYAIAMLPVISGIVAFISRFWFKFEQSINSDFVLKGDEVVYKIIINNNSIFSYSHIKAVFFEDPKSRDRIYSDIETKYFQISAKENKTIKFNIKCLYRGMFEIGADYIEFMDMLGFFKFKFPVKSKVQLLVYPRIVELNTLPVSFIRLSKSSSNLEMFEEDYTTISDIRKYQDSDSYKKIHWKLSAKKRELLVKNYQASVVNKSVFFLDLRQVPLGIEDKLIESVIAVADYCLKKRIPVELNYFADKHEVISERTALGFFNIYSACATVSFSGLYNFYDILNEYFLKQTDYTNIVIFTSLVDTYLAGKIAEMSSFGHNVVLIYITENRDLDILEKLKNSGVVCFDESMLTNGLGGAVV